ncbi:hypothetical protein [Trinickia acidisoli]|uniref:hypothetical protein n=1 Tax=Trinickia acidisoli TaxID=2767482 RepID=UPI001A901DFB|nr:hypothetical protein [Trinickia acidisoli]
MTANKAKPGEAAHELQHRANVTNLSYAKPKPSKVRGPLPPAGQRNTRMAKALLYGMALNYFVGVSAAVNTPLFPLVSESDEAPRSRARQTDDATPTGEGHAADASVAAPRGPLSSVLNMGGAPSAPLASESGVESQSTAELKSSPDPIRVPRSADLHDGHAHHHNRRRGDDHRDPEEPHPRRRGNAHHHHHPPTYDAAGYPIRHGLQNATNYPAERLSEYMQDLINAVESFESAITPALRKLGFEPDELLPVGTVHLGQLDVAGGMQNRMMTAVEIAEHFTTTERHGLDILGQSERANKLIKQLKGKKKHKPKNFFEREALNPLKHKFNKIGRKTILERLAAFGINDDDTATLKRVYARGRVNANIGALQDRVTGDLGSIIEVEKNGEIQRFAVVPHNPDLIVRISANHEQWQRWMKETGKTLFFKNPGTLPAHVHFFIDKVERDKHDRRNPSAFYAVEDILKPIVENTVQHMSNLVTNETPFEEAMHTIVGLYIPYYDFGRATLQGDFKSAYLFLGFELIPYGAEGAKLLVKASFRGARLGSASRTIVDDVIPEAYGKMKDVNGMGILNKGVKPAGRMAVDREDELNSNT